MYAWDILEFSVERRHIFPLALAQLLLKLHPAKNTCVSTEKFILQFHCLLPYLLQMTRVVMTADKCLCELTCADSSAMAGRFAEDEVHAICV